MPVPFVDFEIKPKTRRVYVTYSRMLKTGATNGSKSCENDTSSHNQDCVARFEGAFGRKHADGSFVEPDVSAMKFLVVVLQMICCLHHIIMMSLMKLSPQSKLIHIHDSNADDEADTPTGLSAVASIACDATARLPQKDVQSMFQGSFDQGGTLAATAPLLLLLTRGFQNMVGENIVVLVKMFCSNLLVPKIPTLAKLDMRTV